MKQPKIEIPKAAIADFCKKNHIRMLALFGSVLRDDFTSESDIDVLVEFETGFTPGWGFIRMERELSEILGHRVDLNTIGFLSPYIVDDVIKEAEVMYVAA